MKVIKKPTPLQLVQCKDCKAVLKIKRKDIGLTSMSSFYVVCPICKQWLIFKDVNEIAYKEEGSN